mmetsp:Transcript_6064/g.7908  ORF Transcript_6064/g.7908 Transcript_6064/m.7908 type:complete len:93 (+) Transcript_6064:758-1036(+)
MSRFVGQTHCSDGYDKRNKRQKETSDIAKHMYVDPGLWNDSAEPCSGDSSGYSYSPRKGGDDSVGDPGSLTFMRQMTTAGYGGVAAREIELE